MKLTGAKSISAGGSHTCAIVGAGSAARVRCWGSDASGQLGNTATGVQKYAVLVSGALLNGATSISAGTSHTLEVSPSTALPPTRAIGWGLNTSGQLGDGTIANKAVPTGLPTI